MKFRKLRIAWSVVCGPLCLLFVALWVCSYWGHVGGEVLVTPTYRYEVWTENGTLIVLQRRRTFISFEATLAYPETMFSDVSTKKRLGVGRYVSDYFSAVGLSYWLLILTTVLVGAAPWARWRFSLRTLLIYMTLVAVGLGAIVWVVRKEG
jgi:hypothetical protein